MTGKLNPTGTITAYGIHLSSSDGRHAYENVRSFHHVVVYQYHAYWDLLPVTSDGA